HVALADRKDATSGFLEFDQQAGRDIPVNFFNIADVDDVGSMDTQEAWREPIFQGLKGEGGTVLMRGRGKPGFLLAALKVSDLFYRNRLPNMFPVARDKLQVGDSSLIGGE